MVVLQKITPSRITPLRFAPEKIALVSLPTFESTRLLRVHIKIKTPAINVIIINKFFIPHILHGKSNFLVFMKFFHPSHTKRDNSKKSSHLVKPIRTVSTNQLFKRLVLCQGFRFIQSINVGLFDRERIGPLIKVVCLFIFVDY
jgi:hypothetical protein